MKKNLRHVLALLTAVVLCVGLFSGCGNDTGGTEAEDAGQTAEDSGQKADDGGDKAEKEYYKVGYAAITMDGDFFVTLADALAQGCADQGLIEKADDMVVLDAAWDTAAEVENMDTFIAQGYDVIFIDTTNPDTMIPLIDQATEAGITVICVDSYVSECSRVTVVYGDNKGNGFAAGKTYAEAKGDDFEIYSIMLSGIKGNIAGEERRVGMMAGVLSVRLGLDEEEAFEKAYELNDEVLADNHGKLTTTFSEEDLMSYGAIQACKDADVTGVDHVAAADGLKSAFDKIEAGEMFCCSLNSPALVGELAAKVAYEVKVEGKDPTSYPDTMTPDAICVTKDNVEEYRHLGF